MLLGTRQQGVPVSLRELVLPDGFDPVSTSFTVRDVTTELSGPRPASCSSEVEENLFHSIANSSYSSLVFNVGIMVRTYGPNRECPRNFDFLTYFFTRVDFPTPVQVPLEIGDRKNI
ncbi:unnamed protein product [Schistosoma mattheei]|uniref:Uncharacterized protein n=1 Tax=Schistosoma mattheei TaxID=31246 RepID=A0A183PNP9_9TREM|nr:unnamed protein product [Schistosoma mattheei]